MVKARPYSRLSLAAVHLVAACLQGAAVQPDDVVPYTVAWDGLERGDLGLRSALLDASLCAGLRGQPPANLAQLRRRAADDVAAMEDVLRARGHYAGRVDVRVDRTNASAVVRFGVEPGPVFALGRVHVVVEQPDGSTVSAAPPRGLQRGKPARADAIVAGTERVLQRLREKGHPYPSVATRKLTVDHAASSVDVDLVVRAGPKAVFGPLEVAGLRHVGERYVEGQLPWAAGATYRASDVRELERRLAASGLFATARVEPAPAAGPDGALPIRVTVVERKRRTVRLSLRYDTDVGAGALASLEHRNLFGAGESVRLGGKVSEQESGVAAVYRQPMFLRQDQALVVDAEWKDERPDAYDSESTRAEASIERRLNDWLSAGAGAGYLYSTVTQFGETDDYGFIFAPIRLRWDRTGDLLDPEDGTRLSAEVAPYGNTLAEDLTFWRNTVEGSYYVRLSKEPRLVFAHRVAAGWIVGASREALPADLRFYAGGGGSVRGYEYQTIGDLEDGTPLGGSSLLETSFELRARATESLGFVAFADGGAVYEDTEPASDGAFRWGAGLGLRYYTGIGPFRLDVAFPLNPRDRDDPFAVYVSLGQAF